MADIIIEKIYKLPVFTWGAANLSSSDARAAYLRAVKAADKGDHSLLLEFARSWYRIPLNPLSLQGGKYITPLYPKDMRISKNRRSAGAYLTEWYQTQQSGIENKSMIR